MSGAGELGALPGADAPGEGPVEDALVDALFADAGWSGPSSLTAHVDLLASDDADAVAALVLPASAVEDLRAGLAGGSVGLRVLLASDAADPADGLEVLREARNGLLDDDRVDVVGVALPLPAGDRLATAAHALIGSLDFSAPSWVGVPLVADWDDAVRVVAADGAENLAVDAGAQRAALAAFVRLAVDLDVAFRLTGAAGAVTGEVATPPGTGWLNLLCGVRAALNGAGADEVDAVLACADPQPLVNAARRMSPADCAVVRAFCAAVDVTDVPAALRRLRELGLRP